MRSKSPHEVFVSKVKFSGELPAFLGLIQRHFEKSRPTITSTLNEVTLNAPVDLLDVMLPERFLANIESIEVTYRKGGIKL